MSIIKDIFMDEYEILYSEAMDHGVVDEDKLSNLAMDRVSDRFRSMCDEAKDRMKYEN